jgi:hypothetical protein
MGYHAATGDFCFQLDQDLELKSEDFITEMINPLLQDKNISGSFTRYYPGKDPSWVNKYISYHPLQEDPVYEYFSPSIESSFIQKIGNYYICNFTRKNVPPVGLFFYRMQHLKQSPLWKNTRFFDHETLMGLMEAGYTKFAYVPNAGLYHKHAQGLVHLIQKRVRNLKGHYLKTDSKYKYKWFDATSISGILKIVMWVIYANLFIPATIRGIIRAIKNKDLVFLAEPIVTLAVTDAIIFNFLVQNEGRRFIIKSFHSLVRNILAKTRS